MDFDNEIPEPFSLPLECTECERTHTYEIEHLFVRPESFEDTPENPAEGPVGIVPSKIIECRSCGARDRYRFTGEALETLIARFITDTDSIEKLPPNVDIMDLRLSDGTTFDRPVEALQHLQDKVEQEPEDAFRWMRLGNFAHRFGEREQAEEAFEQALELEEDHAEILYNVADFKRRIPSAVEESMDYFYRAIEEFPSLPDDDRRRLADVFVEEIRSFRRAVSGPLHLHASWLPEENVSEEATVNISAVNLREFHLWESLKIFLAEAPLYVLMLAGDGPGPEDQPTILHQLLERIDQQSIPGSPSSWIVPGAGGVQMELEDTPPTQSAGEMNRSRGSTEPRINTEDVGRNDPCPCGSGEKYKYCCLE